MCGKVVQLPKKIDLYGATELIGRE